VVVFTHLCEALGLFPAMRWGDDDSLGHYIDLGSAALAVTLFPLGYLLHAMALRAQCIPIPLAQVAAP